jgi:hypothetical protein
VLNFLPQMSITLSTLAHLKREFTS